VPARHSRATSILHGWTIDGQEIVVGELRIGAGARIGTRSLLMPGASVGDGAEIEPGSLVRGEVPAGQRWAGSPAVCVGAAGDGWPEPRLPVSGAHPGIRVLYALGLAAPSALALLASLPGILLVAALSPASVSAASLAGAILPLAPLIALSFVVTYALLVALTVRAASPAIQPGRCGSPRRYWAARAGSCSRCMPASTPAHGCGCSASAWGLAPRSPPRSVSTA
jgi:hypothetical protein